MLRTLWLAAALIAAPAAAEPPSSDSPLGRALADAARHDGDGFAFTRALRVVAKDEAVNMVQRYDPTRPEGERWRTLEEDGLPPDPNEQFADQHEGEPLPSYAEVIGQLSLADAELVEETEARAIYRLKEIDAALLEEEEAFAGYLVNELTVDKTGPAPYASELTLYAPEPFRPMAGAEIESFKMRFAYAPDPQTGTILPRLVQVQLAGDALLFFSFEAVTEIEYSDYAFVGTGG